LKQTCLLCVVEAPHFKWLARSSGNGWIRVR